MRGPRSRAAVCLRLCLVLAPLHALAVDERETVVRGTADATDPSEPASVSTVSPGDVPRAGAELVDVLHEVPGIHVTRLGGQGSFSAASIRGSTPEQVTGSGVGLEK